MELDEKDQEKVGILHEEMKKYLEEDKKKKAYSLYLTQEDVEIIRKKIKKPLSKFVDEFIRMMSKGFQQMEGLKEERKLLEGKDGESKKADE